jgi:hypothetical protein
MRLIASELIVLVCSVIKETDEVEWVKATLEGTKRPSYLRVECSTYSARLDERQQGRHEVTITASS